MPGTDRDHPIETPVRSTSPLVGTGLSNGGAAWPRYETTATVFRVERIFAGSFIWSAR